MRLILLVFVLAFLSWSQALAQETITVKFALTGCNAGDSARVSKFNGLRFIPIGAAPIVNDAAAIQLPKTEPRIYYLSTTSGQHLPVVIGSEATLNVQGVCGQMDKAQLVGSPINADYQRIKAQMTEQRNKSSQYIRQLQMKRNDAAGTQQVIAEMAKLDDEKIALFAEAKKIDPFLGKCVAPNVYLSFQNNQGDYTNEIDYYVNETYRFVDWEDPLNEYNPWIYETMRGYVQTLNQVRIPTTKIGEILTLLFNKIPDGSNTKKLAVGGAVAGLSAKAGPALGVVLPYAERVYADDPGSKPFLDAIKASAATYIVGAEAPDFTLNDPDGNPVNLSDFRGKLLLLDFWASWCGPCRRENPNVVKLYNAYKDKGFDILGVSLDKTKDRWVQAIEKDGLTWTHVSDLKGWQSAAARQYSVSSIPATLLIDAEGKIVARNLRGAALEAKVEELLGPTN